jgi:glycosyltransferase involved in cell wall biosynthesis
LTAAVVSSMKILMLSYEFPPLGGGGGKVVDGLTRELVKLGHDIDLVTMGFGGLPQREEIHGVHVHRIPCLRRNAHVCTAPEAASYVLSALPAAWRLLRRNEYDLLHAHFIFPDGFQGWLIRRTFRLPYVITAHGTDVPGYNPHRVRIAHRLLAPLWNATARHAAQIVCPSEGLRTLVTRRSGKVKTAVIPNGIDPQSFRTDRAKEPRILVVSRLLERKGVQYLLQGLNGAPLEYEVEIVGDGPYLPALEKLAETAGAKVHFRGWLDHGTPELKDLYETSSIFILPSQAENFPMVLLEAMAAGLAIITTSETGCAEVVGDAGILVPPHDPAAIRAAVVRLMGDDKLRLTLGQAARQRIEEHFSWHAVGRRYAALYKEHARVRQAAVT